MSRRTRLLDRVRRDARAFGQVRPPEPPETLPDFPLSATQRRGLSFEDHTPPPFSDSAVTALPGVSCLGSLIRSAVAEVAPDSEPSVAKALGGALGCAFVSDAFCWVHMKVFSGGGWRGCEAVPPAGRVWQMSLRFARLARSWHGLCQQLRKPAAASCAVGDMNRRAASDAGSAIPQQDRRFLPVPVALSAAVVKVYTGAFPDAVAILDSPVFRGYVLRVFTWWMVGLDCPPSEVAAHWWVSASLAIPGASTEPKPPIPVITAEPSPPRRVSRFGFQRRSRNSRAVAAPGIEDLKQAMQAVRQRGRDKEAALWRSFSRSVAQKPADDRSEPLITFHRHWFEEGMRIKHHKLPRIRQYNARGLSPLLSEYFRQGQRSAVERTAEFKLAVARARESPEPCQYRDLHRKIRAGHRALDRDDSDAQERALAHDKESARTMVEAVGGLDAAKRAALDAMARGHRRAPLKALKSVSDLLRRADKSTSVLARSRASREAEIALAEADVEAALLAVDDVLGTVGAQARRRLIEWSVQVRAVLEKARRGAERWLDSLGAAGHQQWFAEKDDESSETPPPCDAPTPASPTTLSPHTPPLRFRATAHITGAVPSALRETQTPPPMSPRRMPVNPAVAVVAALCIACRQGGQLRGRPHGRAPRPPPAPDPASLRYFRPAFLTELSSSSPARSPARQPLTSPCPSLLDVAAAPPPRPRRSPEPPRVLPPDEFALSCMSSGEVPLLEMSCITPVQPPKRRPATARLRFPGTAARPPHDTTAPMLRPQSAGRRGSMSAR